MRWSQGRWSEDKLREAVKMTGRYAAIPYGPSGTAPQRNLRELEEYFGRLEKAGLGSTKRPDLLIIRAADEVAAEQVITRLGGIHQLPFVADGEPGMATLLTLAVMAVECENSLWRTKLMPDYGKALTSQRRLCGKQGLSKKAVVPTVILKDEDRGPLKQWQRTHGIPVHIWHAFYDAAYGISLDEAERLVESGLIELTPQTFQAPGGATTRKGIYKIYYHYAYVLAEIVQEPTLAAESITDQNGHVLPYVKFEGGKFKLSSQTLNLLDQLAEQRFERQL